MAHNVLRIKEVRILTKNIIMEIWFNKKNNGIKNYKSRVIGLRFFPQHWKLIQWKNNGAVKGVDKCYDLNIYFLGLFFSYTNFDYNE